MGKASSGGLVEKKKSKKYNKNKNKIQIKKKKGRPSLLDIQKRNLRLQKHTPPPKNSRRYTRRNPNPEAEEEESDENDNKTIRKEKKLNVVLRGTRSLKSNNNSSSSPYLDLGLYGSDSNDDDVEEQEQEEDNDDDVQESEEEEEEEDEEEEEEETPVIKKRKINTGSANKGEKQNSVVTATEKLIIGPPSDSGPTTPLPSKKLLVFILDRIQKKDTYGVYSEPVDANELPDYHEIIENPMDFGTVRKKLEDGAYTTLEQFESDVFLISSNAMQYNSPDTIYFRQARAIQELAKKNFGNLRHDSDNEQEEPKIVRRGRPPKHLKKSFGKTSSEQDGSDATLSKTVDNAVGSNSYNLRKGDRYVFADASRRNFQGSRNNDASSSWMADHKFEKSDELLGSSMKAFSMKYGKKQIFLDESRRNTYTNSHPSAVGSEYSIFDGEKKQLLPHGYARSLARFAANLGPVAWRVASRKIEKSLPPGMKFGCGWVGDEEAPQLQTSSVPTLTPCPLPQKQPLSSTQTLSSTGVPLMVESKDVLLKREHVNSSSLDVYPNRTIPSSLASSSTSVSRISEPYTEQIEAPSRVKDGGFGLMSNGGSGIRPPFQIHQSPIVNAPLNGFSGGFGPNISSQMGKLVRPHWSGGSLSSEGSVHSRMLDMVSRSNFINSMPTNQSELDNTKLPGSSSTINEGTFMPSTGVGLHPQASWNGLLLQQKLDSKPPDLNIRFQSPGSPSSSVRVDSPQPDLALQL
ncbi:hypothetical protein IFM89_003873 [Coptis chinensis]|uniref:Bromo domain-containing protein n=1 Tax=Coptis chinensis TaxID=261450 RepID=A0A835I0X2_9MAGN|nr:hypothetical protein IFM89_003873 [Coptis chinensis]